MAGQGAARKRVPLPPSPERLKAIHDVVAGVLGISQERGDQLVIESLPFEQTRMMEDSGGGGSAKPPAAAPFSMNTLLHDRRVWMGGGGALVLIAVLAFVMRSRKKKIKVEEAPIALPAGSGKATAAEVAASASESSPAKSYLPRITSKAQGMLVQIQETVARDPAFAANVVRGWMEED